MDYLSIAEARKRRGLRLVAVLFADHPIAPEALKELKDAGFAGVMLDTANKAGGALPRLLAGSAVARFTDEARARGLLTGLAGSLGRDDIPGLLPYEPDYLGFRGALCRSGRAGRLDPDRVRAVRRAIPEGGLQAVSASAAAGAQRAAQALISSVPSNSAPKSR